MSGAPLALRKRGRRRGFALAIGVRLWLMSQRDSGARNIPGETTRSSGPVRYSATPDPIGIVLLQDTNGNRKDRVQEQCYVD